ncbi:MAG: thiamine-monophosphate kinase [Halioglobus sp.]|jgi:thiamine-monophosphate kinase
MPSSEFSLIARYFSSLGRGPDVDLSVGDDCAILRLQPNERLATSVDTLVSGVHFPEDAFPEDLGFRAVAVAVSDLAAMGARPIGMTLALTLPEADDFWLNAFSNGLAAAVQAFNIPLIGGDTTRGPLTLTVQVLGALPLDQGLLRSGAVAGDQVCVSGPLGDAAGALAFMEGSWTPDAKHADYLWERFYRPLVKIELGRSLLGVAHAAIDISDGLLADAGHIADASGVGISIDPALVPQSEALRSHSSPDQSLLWALTGGDDYELCFTLPAEQATPEGCVRIGEVIAGKGVNCGIDIDTPTGYRHF